MRALARTGAALALAVGCGGPAPVTQRAPAVAPAPAAEPVADDDVAPAACRRFSGDACELASLRWEERDTDGRCTRDYAVLLVDPAAGTERRVALASLPCPRWWYRCGPTPVCEYGAQSRTDWRVDLEGPFPIRGADHEGIIVRIADPDGDELHFFDVAGEDPWRFGSRRADYVAVGADRVEILTCDDGLDGVRVVGAFEGRMVDYNEPPTLGLSCATLY